MKTIRHKWNKTHFLEWTCDKCGMLKFRDNGITWYQRGDRTSIIDFGCIFMNESPKVRDYRVPRIDELDTDCMGNCFTDADPGL